MNEVDISERNVTAPSWKARLRRFTRAVLRHIGKHRWSVSLLLCDDSCIRELNRTYRGKDLATDVLSFRQQDASATEMPAHINTRPGGDIVISLDTLKRNASALGVSFGDEIKRLVVHGLLHLDGMDHDDDDEQDPMFKLQDQILDDLSRRRIV